MSSFPVLSPRAAKTRGALLAAGLELLAERPVDAIAIDDLVAAAGVAKGSFFNHFADKRAFAQTIAEDIRREVEARVAATNQGVTDPLERLAGGMIAAAAFALTERKRMVVLAGAGRGMIDMAHPLNDGVRRDFAAAVAAGILPFAPGSDGGGGSPTPPPARGGAGPARRPPRRWARPARRPRGSPRPEPEHSSTRSCTPPHVMRWSIHGCPARKRSSVHNLTPHG